MTNLSYPRRQKQLESLLQIIGIQSLALVNWQLLDLALTHPSVSSQANYEQLEFVGDAVVRLVAAEVLWEVYPDWKVGEFAAIRSVLVSDRILAFLATKYSIESYLLVTSSDKEGQQSRLADAFEAVLGALYLSTHTLELIRPWLDPHFMQLATEIRSDPARLNYKAALQEWTQGHFKVLPEYRVIENTQGHRPMATDERFSAQVWLQDRLLGQGIGRSIKAAEQAAAQVAFRVLSQQEE
ncbi:ribonuclease III [Synechocystis sp. PCC 7509]|uniref:ribonuclease III n=1 Tax=Synechocystis sp. PCC 7509 TaxID=927677 RepID=UPI0002AC38AE|nr:ribonuclease III [Synechocystis sp. PCC 7509]